MTFFLTGAGASIQSSGQSDWHLVASTSGPFPGFVFFLDPSGPSGLAGTASSFSGQSELYFEGVVYLPQQQVTISGGADTIAPSPYTSYIVDTLILNGQGTITINNDLTMTSVPIPSALQVTLGGSPRLAM